MTTDNPSPEPLATQAPPPSPAEPVMGEPAAFATEPEPIDAPDPIDVEQPAEAVAVESAAVEPETTATAPKPKAKAKPRSRKAASARAGDASPAAEVPAIPPVVNENFKWYVVKVQSGREESIRDAIERRVKIEGLQESFGQILIPIEKRTEVRNNKRVVKEYKKFPGYVMANLEFNDRMLYLFRETSGVGDFVGGGLNKPPQPMPPHEVERMLGQQGQLPEKTAPEKPKFDKGDRVSVKDGTFAGMEGEVKEILEGKGAVRVELTIFGRPVPVELEYWQVDYA